MLEQSEPEILDLLQYSFEFKSIVNYLLILKIKDVRIIHAANVFSFISAPQDKVHFRVQCHILYTTRCVFSISLRLAVR